MKRIVTLLLVLAATAIPAGAQAQSNRRESAYSYTSTGTYFAYLGTACGTGSAGTQPPKCAPQSEGTRILCKDCAATLPCAAGGNGAYATRLNGSWNCLGGATGTVAANALISGQSGARLQDLTSDINATMYAKLHGVSGSQETATITSGALSTSITIDNAKDFENLDGVFIPHGGPACTMNGGACPTGPTPTVYVAIGTPASHTYKVACLDAARGMGAAGGGASAGSGATALDDNNRIHGSFTMCTGATAAVIYRDDQPILITRESFFDDWGQAAIADDEIPSSPPASGLNDRLVTHIVTGGGSTSLTLADAPSINPSGLKLEHDDTAATNTFLAACAAAHAICNFGNMFVNTTGPLTYDAAAGYVAGVVFNSIATGFWPHGDGYVALTIEYSGGSGVGYDSPFRFGINNNNRAGDGAYIINPAEMNLESVYVHDATGYCLKIDRMYDSILGNIAIVGCGSPSSYAFSINDGTDSSNESITYRLQVELSAYKAINIGGGLSQSMVFSKMHSEREHSGCSAPTAGSGCNSADGGSTPYPLWNFSSNRTTYNELRLTAGNPSETIADLGGASTLYSLLQVEGAITVVANSGVPSFGVTFQAPEIQGTLTQGAGSGQLNVFGGWVSTINGTIPIRWNIQGTAIDNFEPGFQPSATANRCTVSGAAITTVDGSLSLNSGCTFINDTIANAITNPLGVAAWLHTTVAGAYMPDTLLNLYDVSGNLQAGHSFIWTGNLVSGTPSTLAMTIPAAAAFSAAGSYRCSANDDTSISALQVVQSSGTAFTVSGPGSVTDQVSGICVGY